MIDPDKIIVKDYSRKPYRFDGGYTERQRSITDKAKWNAVLEVTPSMAEFTTPRELTVDEQFETRKIKQSEFKKPRENQDYADMEHNWDGPPGVPYNAWTPNFPDHPWVSPWPTQEPVPGGPGFWILDAFTEYAYCPGTTKRIVIHGTHPIYKLEFTFPGLLAPGTSFSIVSGLASPNVTIDLTVDEAETQNPISMRAYMEAYNAPPPPSTQGKGWAGFSIPKGTLATSNPALNPVPKDECGFVFWFGLQRDDGDVVDSGDMATADLKIKRVSDSGTPPNETGFDSGSGLWWIWLKEWPTTGGYWVKYGPDDWSSYFALQTQYPYRYKLVDMENPSDGIFPDSYNVYTDNVPVWDHWDTLIIPPDFTVGSSIFGCPAGVPPGFGTVVSGGILQNFLMSLGNSASLGRIPGINLNVASSVPYGVTYDLTAVPVVLPPFYFVWATYNSPCPPSWPNYDEASTPGDPHLRYNIYSDDGSLNWLGNAPWPTLQSTKVENSPSFIPPKIHWIKTNFLNPVTNPPNPHDISGMPISFKTSATSPRDMP